MATLAVHCSTSKDLTAENQHTQFIRTLYQLIACYRLALNVQAQRTAREQKEKQRQYAEVAAREAARAQAQRAAARQQYEELEAKQAEELEARREVERRLAEERRLARLAKEAEEQAAREVRCPLAPRHRAALFAPSPSLSVSL